jgi:hypothetical protein
MGLIDHAGHYVTGMRFSEISHLHNGLASVRDGNLYGYIDRTGNSSSSHPSPSPSRSPMRGSRR